MSQKYNSEYVNENEAFFIGRNDIINRYGNVISHYLMLPGLIGFWPMATVQRSTGNVPNYAPTYTGATKQDLVYNGNPVFNYTSTGVPYIDLDGTGDYLSIADNTDLDILGTETIYNNPGLTMGCWAKPTSVTPSSFDGVMGKMSAAAGNVSYDMIAFTAGSVPYMLVSDDGSTQYNGIGPTVPTAGTWHLWVGRCIVSSEIIFFDNGVWGTPAVPGAGIFNGNASFEIGRRSAAGTEFTGSITLAFLCATALSDAIIQSLFQQTRSLFGV